MRFADRKEQRVVTETMNALLLPAINYMESKTRFCIKKTLQILNDTKVVGEEEEDEEYGN